MSLVFTFWRRLRVVLTLFVVGVSSVSGQGVALLYGELTDHLTTIEAERLEREGQIVNVDFEFQPSAALAFAPTLVAERIGRFSAEGEGGVAVEALFFTRLTDSERELATPRVIYNIIRSISTLTGITYYSASRGRDRIFYEDSYVISEPKSKTPQPDPLLADDLPIPASDMQYLRQRDSSFGENAYSALYGYQDMVTTLEIINLTTMFYTIIPLVKPQQLRTLFVIIPSAEGVVFYGVSLVALGAGGAFGLEERASNSFTNRLIAVSDWFADQLTESIREAGG